jgi:hypothetical protein
MPSMARVTGKMHDSGDGCGEADTPEKIKYAI